MEKINKLNVIVVFLIINLISGQNKKVSTEQKEAFLIGMFNHFNGDVYIPEHPVLKDRLTFFLKGKEELLKVFKDSISMYSKENDFKYEIRENQFEELYKLSENNPFAKYYKKDRAPKGVYSDPKNDIEYNVYFLHLKKSAFKGKKMKYSFLLGAFLNNGQILSNDICCFKGNPVYIDFIISILKNLKIEIIEIELPKEKTEGALKIVKFKTSNEVKEMLMIEKTK